VHRPLAVVHPFRWVVVRDNLGDCLDNQRHVPLVPSAGGYGNATRLTTNRSGVDGVLGSLGPGDPQPVICCCVKRDVVSFVGRAALRCVSGPKEDGWLQTVWSFIQLMYQSDTHYI